MTPTKPEHIYVAGPMQGIPAFNFPRFNAVSNLLKKDGHTVFNPAERDIARHGGVDISLGNTTGSLAEAKGEHKFSLRDALADDLEFICRKATVIIMLPGWEKSNGAQAEHRTAVALISEGMEIVYLPEDACIMMEDAASMLEDIANG